MTDAVHGIKIHSRCRISRNLREMARYRSFGELPFFNKKMLQLLLS